MARHKRLGIDRRAALAGQLRASIPTVPSEDGEDTRKQGSLVRLRARITLPRVSIQPADWRKLWHRR